MTRATRSAPHPGTNRVRHKQPPGQRAKDFAADPEKYADWTPMKARGRPRMDGEKPISLPDLRFMRSAKES